jgi:hypothetical protein
MSGFTGKPDRAAPCPNILVYDSHDGTDHDVHGFLDVSGECSPGLWSSGNSGSRCVENLNLSFGGLAKTGERRGRVRDAID